MKDATPMMEQYRRIKSRYKDALLFFRLGDFYEMFYEDAEIGSKELGIALTGRDAGEGERAPLCGVPYRAADEYIKALVDKGYRIAICEQVEDPALAKGLVKREVVRVITPGTYWEGAENKSSSYIASILPLTPQNEILGKGTGKRYAGSVGFCACDLSTGEVLLAQFEEEASSVRDPRTPWNRFFEEVSRLKPKECIFPQSIRGTDFYREIERRIPEAYMNPLDDGKFSPEPSSSYEASFGLAWDARKAAGEQGLGAQRSLEALLTYLRETQMIDLKHLKEPRLYLKEAFMEIDRSTGRNLELTERLQGGFYGSLAWVLDRCCTSMGSRLLKKWLERPLARASEIQERLDAVDELLNNAPLRERVRKSLSGVKDLERLVTKISYKTCNARDLVAIAASLETIPNIKEVLRAASSSLLCRIGEELHDLPDVTRAIREGIVDDPPLTLTEGGIIRDGYSQEVDRLRELSSGAKRWVLEMEQEERERTGIKNLRVGYNRVFGYYIEVTRSNLAMVPDRYVRKQTLASSERFITPELKEKETLILGAEEKLFKEEYNLFCQIREVLADSIGRIQREAALLSELDVLASFAEAAGLYGYVKPVVKDEGPIVIRDGRHPVLERVLPPGSFVPNDLVLSDDERVLIITGPNMGGKSTYIRQAALLVLMAQAGSFVPAQSCALGCVDKLFARVGAYDDLVLGQSTFMVEMSEASRILRSATKKSLVILDEIGRGTSTFDGLSVAWAIIEYLADEKTCGSKTLVATHYRELTLLSDLKREIGNFHVAVKRSGEDIVFLRKVVPGVAEGSFGIDVARMAGLPEEVVKRAKEILAGLETEARRGSRWTKGILGQMAMRSAGIRDFSEPQGQIWLFDLEPNPETVPSSAMRALLDELESLNPDLMTPKEALLALYSLKNKIPNDK